MVTSEPSRWCLVAGWRRGIESVKHGSLGLGNALHMPRLETRCREVQLVKTLVKRRGKFAI